MSMACMRQRRRRHEGGSGAAAVVSPVPRCRELWQVAEVGSSLRRARCRELWQLAEVGSSLRRAVPAHRRSRPGSRLPAHGRHAKGGSSACTNVRPSPRSLFPRRCSRSWALHMSSWGPGCEPCLLSSHCLWPGPRPAVLWSAAAAVPPSQWRHGEHGLRVGVLCEIARALARLPQRHCPQEAGLLVAGTTGVGGCLGLGASEGARPL